jgi:hypothetical protein
MLWCGELYVTVLLPMMMKGDSLLAVCIKEGKGDSSPNQEDTLLPGLEKTGWSSSRQLSCNLQMTIPTFRKQDFLSLRVP